MADAAPATCDPARITSWQDLRFGLFLHWGLYSLTAGYWQGRRALSSGHIMLHERIPVETWGRLAADFVPTRFDANAWVAAALAAGMKYLVITTKHHDGLAMFDSPSSGYDIVHLSPWGVDPMAEIARACHAQGLRLGFYYSLGRDWQDPDVPTDWPEKGGRSNTWDYPDEDAKDFSRYFARKVKPQITELLTRYGRVDMLWFDTPEKISREQSTELLDLIRSLQPECLVNDRIGSELGDYATREQKIGAVQNDRPWESCVTMARHWNYDRDELPYYKPADLLIHQLVETVSKGGNYLLNIGPTPEGTLPDAALARLAAIGRWLAVHGEGIYGSRPWRLDAEPLTAPAERECIDREAHAATIDAENDATAKVIPAEVRFTRVGDTIYAFICNWHSTTVRITALAEVPVCRVDLLGDARPLVWRRSAAGLEVELPESVAGTVPVIRGLRITTEAGHGA